MMLPDLTQQAEALLMPIAAVSVANAWALTRPLSRPFPYNIFQYSHATVAQTLLASVTSEYIHADGGGQARAAE